MGRDSHQACAKVAERTGLEPATPGVTDVGSIVRKTLIENMIRPAHGDYLRSRCVRFGAGIYPLR